MLPAWTLASRPRANRMRGIKVIRTRDVLEHLLTLHLACEVGLRDQVVSLVSHTQRDVVFAGPKRVGHDLDNVPDSLLLQLSPVQLTMTRSSSVDPSRNLSAFDQLERLMKSASLTHPCRRSHWSVWHSVSASAVSHVSPTCWGVRIPSRTYRMMRSGCSQAFCWILQEYPMPIRGPLK